MRTIPFGDCFKFIRNGMNVRQDKSGDGLPVTRIETISSETVNPERVGYANLQENACAEWLLQSGDILFSHINSVAHIGKCAVYRGEPEKLVHGMNLLCLRCDEELLYPEFAKYLIRNSAFRAQLAGFINKAVNQASVSIGNLKTIQVTVPAIPEQRRIAEVLDRADALRAKRRAAVAELDTLTQAIFLDLFGDPVRLGRWETKLLKDVARVSSGAGFPLEYQGQEEGQYPFFKVSDMNVSANQVSMVKHQHAISEQVRRKLRAEAFPAGSIVFPKIGAAIATNKKRRIVRPSCIDNNVMAVVPGEALDSTYLFSLLKLKNLSDFAQRGNPPSMRKTDVESWLIPVPEMPLQLDFAQKAEAVNRLKASHDASLGALDALFDSLQHRAFRGEL